MARRARHRNFEMRVRNNFASAFADDEPARSTRLVLEAVELARQLGDRGMYNWTLGTPAIGSFFEGTTGTPHRADA